MIPLGENHLRTIVRVYVARMAQKGRRGRGTGGDRRQEDRKFSAEASRGAAPGRVERGPPSTTHVPEEDTKGSSVGVPGAPALPMA